MAAFEYTAIGADGRRTKGVISADSPRAARKELRLRQLTPLKVAETRGEEAAGALKIRGGLSAKQRALITRQLAMLLQSEMTVEQALAAAAGDGENPATRKLLLGMRAQVMEGNRLADAMLSAPKAFPPLYRSVVAAGEASGKLGEVMERLADYLEKTYKLRTKVQSALIYPAVLGVMALGMVTALMVFIVPRLIEQFDMLGADRLPLITRVVIAASNFVRDYGLIMLAVIVIGGFLFQRAARTLAVKHAIDRVVLRVPFFGSMNRTVSAARFARIYATLSGSGAPVLESLSAAKGAMTNSVFANAADDIAEAVREGRSFSGAMRTTGVFPAVMTHMVASGEAGRNLPGMMNRSAEFLEAEFENASSVALGLLEPLIIIILGVVVGLIVLSIMLPIMQLNTLALG